MCDQHFEDDLKRYRRRAGVTRREFAALSASAGLMAMLPRAADALEVSEADVEIITPDGLADCYFVHPSVGKHPAILVWPDIMGLRPTFRQMGRRLAESGYAVLVVNPFYREHRAPVVPAGASLADDAIRNLVFPLARTLSATTHVTDARAFIAWLDAQDAVDTSRLIGTAGYCMGGPMVMRTAAAVADRVGAGASFHGGGLATDQPDSPHQGVSRMNANAHLLIAIAENDDAREPDVKHVLSQTFEAAGLSAEIEIYPAGHGWCVPDSPVYDEAQAERAWGRLLALFETALS
jgi:carboxymethylenebutenolidase